MWFLNTRSEPSGGDVCPVRVTDGPLTYLTCPQELSAEVRGSDLLIGVHGFNVHQAQAIDHLVEWNTMLALGGTGMFLGALWPGDSSWIGAVEYVFAAQTAMRAGDSLAAFINGELMEAASVSFVSHSLGARVVLEAIRKLDPSMRVRRLVMMAPAVDNDCLTKEFQSSASRVEEITIMASMEDKVLKVAFPLGNPISGVFAEGHPFWHSALGRNGPSSYPNPNNIKTGWQLPDSWMVDHSDYLPPPSPYPPGFQPGPYTLPLAWPASSAAAPATGAPPGFQVGGEWRYWQSAWTAGLTSTRFQ